MGYSNNITSLSLSLLVILEGKRDDRPKCLVMSHRKFLRNECEWRSHKTLRMRKKKPLLHFANGHLEPLRADERWKIPKERSPTGFTATHVLGYHWWWVSYEKWHKSQEPIMINIIHISPKGFSQIDSDEVTRDYTPFHPPPHFCCEITTKRNSRRQLMGIVFQAWPLLMRN